MANEGRVMGMGGMPGMMGNMPGMMGGTTTKAKSGIDNRTKESKSKRTERDKAYRERTRASDMYYDVVEVTVYGAADVDFTEISNYRVRGTATRTAGTDAVMVVIHWVNRNMTTTVSVGGQPVPFSMESGDIDKRSAASAERRRAARG